MGNRLGGNMKLALAVIALAGLSACQTAKPIDTKELNEHYFNLGRTQVDTQLVENNRQCFQALDNAKTQIEQLRGKLDDCLNAGEK